MVLVQLHYPRGVQEIATCRSHSAGNEVRATYLASQTGSATIHAMLCSKPVPQQNRSGETSCHSSATYSAHRCILSQTSVVTPFEFWFACDTRVFSKTDVSFVPLGFVTCSEDPQGLIYIFLWQPSHEHMPCVTPRQREAEEQCWNVSISLGFNKSTNHSDPLIRVIRCARSSGSKSRLCSDIARACYQPSGPLFQRGTRCLW